MSDKLISLDNLKKFKDKYTEAVDEKIAAVSGAIPTKTSDLQNDSGFITKDVDDLTNYTKSSSLATVATTGSYNDLSNKPTIPTVPTQTSQLTNNGADGTSTYVEADEIGTAAQLYYTWDAGSGTLAFSTTNPNA